MALTARGLRIQLWSYNYDPEPTGIAPLSTAWARQMLARGHQVEVVAAHPHYPEPVWGSRSLPYRENRDGVSVLRLPLMVGRATTAARLRQELSFTAAQASVAPTLATPDVIVAVSPSFPAIAPAMVNARLRRIPLVLWIQDILPDGAAVTGIVDDGPVLRAARRFERAAYRAADHIIVISDSFVANLRAKGVPEHKLTRVYNWPTRPIGPLSAGLGDGGPPRVLCMGNVGHSQGLVEIVRAWERDPGVAAMDARLVIAGAGVALEDVRREVRSHRVELTGLLFAERLEEEMRRATLGAVTQRYDGVEFNVPSKLMNYLAVGLPVVGALREGSEAAGLIERAGAGWVRDSSRPEGFSQLAVEALGRPEELLRRGRAGLAFARDELAADRAAARSEAILHDVVDRHRRGAPRSALAA
jgi:colanic acid biosynthesis glycosyl transferase WcaI